MSRSRRYLSAVTLGYGYQAVVMVAGLWLTPFLLHKLGQSDYGLWLVATQIIGYFTLMDFGIVGLLPRETAYITGRSGGYSNATELSGLIEKSFQIVLWQTPIVLVAACVTWVLIPGQWEAMRYPLVLLLGTFVLFFPARIFYSVLGGLQDFSFLGYLQLVTWFVGTSVTVVMVLAGFHLYSLVVGWMVIQGLSYGVSIIRVWLKFPKAMPRKWTTLSWDSARGIVSASLWVSVGQIAHVLLDATDILVIGRLLGPAAAVPYSCTAKLVSVLANQPGMLVNSAGPALAEVRADSDPVRTKQVSTALLQATLIGSGAIAVAVAAVNQGFVEWWVGRAQFGGLALTVALLGEMLLRHWVVGLAYPLFCFGYERRISLTGIVDGLTTVTLSLILIPRLGLIGAPIASIAGACAISLAMNLSVMARETSTDVAGTLSPLWPWLWRFALLAGATVLIAVNWVPRQVYQMLLFGGAVGVAYVLIMLSVVLRPPLGEYARPFLSQLLERLSLWSRLARTA